MQGRGTDLSSQGLVPEGTHPSSALPQGPEMVQAVTRTECLYAQQVDRMVPHSAQQVLRPVASPWPQECLSYTLDLTLRKVLMRWDGNSQRGGKGCVLQGTLVALVLGSCSQNSPLPKSSHL